MRKLINFLLAIHIIMVCWLARDVYIYQIWFPRLVWAADTMRLNVIANRKAWRACEASKHMREIRLQIPRI